MHSLACALLLALVFSASSVLRAEEALPPIFAPRPAPTPPATAPRASLLSERMHGLLTEQMLTQAKAFPLPKEIDASPAAASTATDGAVMMERYVVSSQHLPVREAPTPDSPLLNFLNTGKLYHDVGKRVTTDISLNFFIIGAVGYGHAKEATRAELKFNFRW